MPPPYGYYAYDAWGNVTAYTSTGGTPATTSLIYRNPLRYRGYIYDNETGFYYLQSRYYDPANHRFINADGYESTGQGFVGTNKFAYCNNSPVIFADPSGNMAGGTCTTIINDGGGAYPLPQGLYYTADQAALAFAGKYYRYTYLTGNEVAAFILRTTYKGRSAYYWAYVEYSKNTEIGLGIYDVAEDLSKGSMIVGDIHTHPRARNADVFSIDDVLNRKEFLNDKNISCVDVDVYSVYLVTPLRTVVKMDTTTFAYEGIFVGRYQLGLLGGKHIIDTKYCMN